MRVSKLPKERTARTILHVFPSFEVGGTQTGFCRVANRLQNEFQHLIIALDGNTACAVQLCGGLDYALIPFVMQKSHTMSLANMVSARRTLREILPDLLITYSWGAIEWALANRWAPVCRHIHVEDGFNIDETNEDQKLRRVMFRRMALRHDTLIVVPSQTLHRIATRKWGFRSSRVLYVPNGIDVEKFAAGTDRSILPQLGGRRDDLIIGTLSGLRPVKRIDRLIRAFAAFSTDIRSLLVIVGDGPERARLECLAHEMGVADRTLFAGNIASPERALGLFDIFVLSSDSEQMPFAIIEAMAAGLPIVATDVGDVKGIVAPENRPLIVPSASEQELLQALCELVRDPALRGVLGNLNQKKARHEFSESTMIRTYRALFDGSIRNGSPLA